MTQNQYNNWKDTECDHCRKEKKKHNPLKIYCNEGKQIIKEMKRILKETQWRIGDRKRIMQQEDDDIRTIVIRIIGWKFY